MISRPTLGGSLARIFQAFSSFTPYGVRRQRGPIESQSLLL